MANFPNQQLTDLGWDALSEALTGRKILFDRVMAGQGYLDPAQDPDDLSNMTDLEDYVMDMQIAGMTADGFGRATIYATLISRDVPVGFYLRELGVTCTIGEAPDVVDPQVLYSICNAGDQSTYIPAADETSKVVLGVEIHIIIGKALNIDVTITAGTIRAVNLGDPLEPGQAAVFARQTGLLMEFRRLRSQGSITLLEGPEYLDIGGGLPLPLPGEPGGPDDGGPIDPDTTLAGLVPVGTILPYGGGAPPAGYLWCHGQEEDRTQYARLFSIIGTQFGAGNGVTTFNTPGSQGQVFLGFDGVSPVGTRGGAATVTLDLTQIPSHGHSGNIIQLANHTHSTIVGDHRHGLIGDGNHTHGEFGHSHPYIGPEGLAATARFLAQGTFGGSIAANTTIGVASIAFSGALWGPETMYTSQYGGQPANIDFGVNALLDNGVIQAFAVGGGAAHSNMQPSIVVNYIIKF